MNMIVLFSLVSSISVLAKKKHLDCCRHTEMYTQKRDDITKETNVQKTQLGKTLTV